MHFVVYGAGAVGSVLGGLLSLQRHDVLFVCRADHARAIADNGLRMRSATGDYIAHPRTTDTLSASDLSEDPTVFLTVKSHDTGDSVEALTAVIPASSPVFALQNGIGNEELVAAQFERVYGGICRMTCSMLQPGSASFRKLGRVVVGRYPKGSDALARSVCEAFTQAGLDSCVSRNIMADRWLKLAVNAQSAVHAIVDPRDHDANEFFEFKACLLEEVGRVYRAARIRARSCDGRDPAIAQMIEDLRRPRAKRTSHGMNVHNSTWQDLYLKRDVLETPRYHELLIELAGEHGIAVPYNEATLAALLEVHASGAGPESMRLSELRSAVEERKGAR